MPASNAAWLGSERWKVFLSTSACEFLKLAFVLPLIYKDWWQRNHPTGRIRYKNIPVPKHTSIILALLECNASENVSVEHGETVEELLMVSFQRKWWCYQAPTETTLTLGLQALVPILFSARRDSSELWPRSLQVQLVGTLRTELKAGTCHLKPGQCPQPRALRERRRRWRTLWGRRHYFGDEANKISSDLEIRVPDHGASQPMTFITLYVTFAGGILASK